MDVVFMHQNAFALSAGKLGFALSARPGYEVADLIVDLVSVPEPRKHKKIKAQNSEVGTTFTSELDTKENYGPK